MKKLIFISILFVILYFISPQILLSSNDRLKVFFECPSGCPKTEVMNEIKFVDFINTKDKADIHVKFNSINISQNMMKEEILFFGVNDLNGTNDTLSFIHNQNNPEVELFNTATKTIKVGLMKYMTNLVEFDKIDIIYLDSSKTEISIIDKADIWNNWTFNTGFSGFFNGEKSYSNNNYGLNFSTERIMKENKILLNGYLNNNESIYYDFESDTTFNEDGTFTVSKVDYKSQQSSNGFTIQFIKSIKEHTGIGIKLRYYSSTHNNIYRSISISPGIEYNFFPYSEATYNRLSVLYNIKPVYNQYLEETIYYHKSETLFQHRLAGQIKWMKSWGTISSNIYYKNYLHDFSQNDYGINGNVTLNLIRNISIEFEMHGEIDHAQLSLPNEDASKEQILLRIQELESQFSYFFIVGFSYTFGSSQVPYYNPRMDDWGW